MVNSNYFQLSRYAVLLTLVLLVTAQQSVEAQVVAIVGQKEVSGKDVLPEAKQVAQQRKNLPKEEFNNWLRKQAGIKLQGIILGRLLEELIAKEGIEPTDEEIGRFIRGSKAIERKEAEELQAVHEGLELALQNGKFKGKELARKNKQLKSLSRIIQANEEADRFAKEYPEEQQRIQRNIGKKFVKSWKINKALHDRYGGRVIFQQAGPEPLDAYRIFLKEQQKKGSFSIKDKRLEKAFWRYFTDDKMHLFLPDTDGRNAIDSPWWMGAATPTS